MATDISLATKIRCYHFPTCLMNAAGPRCTTLEEIVALQNCPYTGAVVSKSATLLERSGNLHPRYHHDQNYSINSTGLANHGYQFYQQFYDPHFQFYCPDKHFYMSIAGLTMDDNLGMLRAIEEQACQLEDEAFHGEVLVELNLSCPNIIGKPQIGYDFDSSEELLRKIFEQNDPKPNHICLGLKLPPYFDFVHYEKMTEVINQFPIGFLVCINSLGNTLIIDPITETPVIHPKGGYGGLGGACIKPVALANVHKFHQLLPNMPIIGCGGVKNGSDVFEHILAGATMVQIGTQLMIEGVDCFKRIANELIDLMEKKGYQSIYDFKGKLKELPSI